MSDGDGEPDEPVTVEGATPPDPTPAPVGGLGGAGGAPDDRELPLTVHIEEMLRRLAVVIVVMAVVSGITFPFADRLINFLWFSFLPGSPANCPPPGPLATVATVPETPIGVVWRSFGPGVAMDVAPPATADATDACARLYHPLSLVLARLKVATLVGFIAALPVFVYETYLFMRPGLYYNERRYYLASVPTSLVLAGMGLAFAYFLVLPLIFTYFLGYSEPVAEIAFGLSETFGLILLMLGMFALVFQIPLFVMLAIMMGVTSRRWLESRRLYFWAAFAGIAFLFSPDPTGMAPFMVAATMVVLFEGTLLLLRWSGADSMAPGRKQVAALRPAVWLLAAVGGYLAGPWPVSDGYNDAIPAAVTGVLAAVGVGGAAPILIGIGLLVAFEGVVFLLRRTRRAPRFRRLLARVRLPAWLVAVAAGYLASPEPLLLREAQGALLSAQMAVAVAVLAIVLYEVGLAVWRHRAS